MMVGNILIVHGVIKRDNNYLVIKRTLIKRGVKNMYPCFWDIPGGTVENGELPRQALHREIYEEVGLRIKIGSILHEDSNLDKDKNIIFTRLVYECFIESDINDPIILDPEEHTEYKLISTIDELAEEDVVPYVYQIIAKNTF